MAQEIGDSGCRHKGVVTVETGTLAMMKKVQTNGLWLRHKRVVTAGAGTRGW